MPKRLSDKTYRRLGLLFVACSLAFSLGNVLRFVVSYSLPMNDALWRWQECAYVLRGFNPFDVMQGVEPADPFIGELAPSGGTMPWSYVLGNVFNPGWCSFATVRLYLGCLYATLPVLCAMCVYAYLTEHRYISDPKRALAASLLVFAPSLWANAVFFGNQSGIICCLIVLSMFLLENHPILTGVVLAFAMCKPQIAAVFFLPLLVKGKWKTIATSVVIVLAGWVAAVRMTNTRPLEMLLQMLTQGLGYTNSYYSYYGIFNILLGFGVPSNVVLVLDVAFACAVFALLARLLFREGLEDDWLCWFSLIAVLSTCWFYKQSHDYVILMLPCIAVFTMDRPPLRQYLNLFIINGQLLSQGIPMAAGRLFGIEKANSYPWGKLLESLLILATLPAILAAAREHKAKLQQEAIHDLR